MALKDHENQKIPSKELCHVKYHSKMQTLTESSIPSCSVTFGANDIHLHPLRARDVEIGPEIIDEALHPAAVGRGVVELDGIALPWNQSTAPRVLPPAATAARARAMAAS